MTAPEFVVFAAWRCNCTIVAAGFADVPDVCPVHGKGLLGPASWEKSANGFEMGFRDASAEVVESP